MDLTYLYRRLQADIGGLKNDIGGLKNDIGAAKMQRRRMFGVTGILFMIVLLLLIFPEESREWLLSIMAIIGVWGHIVFWGVFLRLVVFALCPNFTEDELLGSFLRHLGSFLLGSFLCHLFVPLRRARDRMDATADPPAHAPTTPPTRAEPMNATADPPAPAPTSPPDRARPPSEVDSEERFVRCLTALANKEGQDGSAGRFVKLKVNKLKFVADQVCATATALTQVSPSGENSARPRSVPQTRPGPPSRM
jgi:hypothetical protein